LFKIQNITTATDLSGTQRSDHRSFSFFLRYDHDARFHNRKPGHRPLKPDYEAVTKKTSSRCRLALMRATNGVFTPSTRTRQNCLVLSRRRCEQAITGMGRQSRSELNGQLRIITTIVYTARLTNAAGVVSALVLCVGCHCMF